MVTAAWFPAAPLQRARAALLRTKYAWAADCIRSVGGDGRRGHAPSAPFDAIYLGGSCPEVPASLVEQLAVGGRMLLCVGDEDAPQETGFTKIAIADEDSSDEEVVEINATGGFELPSPTEDDVLRKFETMDEDELIVEDPDRRRGL